MNSKYSSYGTDSDNNSGSSSDGDFDKDAVLKWRPHATVRGVMDTLQAGDNDWGQSLGIKLTDTKLVDGVLMDRLDSNGNPDGTIKLFAWENMPILADEFTVDDAPEVFTEEFGGTTYRYQLRAARVEQNENPAEPIPFNDIIMWEGGGDQPSSSALVFAQMLTTKGRDIINDRESIFNWLHTGLVELREDLIGREVDMFKVEKQGDEHKFHSPVVIDVATGEEVRISNDASDSAGETSTGTQAATDGGTAAESGGSTTTPTPGGYPEPVADFVEFCVDFGLDDEEQILGNLNEMADESGNSLTTEMVDGVGEDAILADILG